MRVALAGILASPQFVNSPQLSRFMRHIVEHTLAGELTLLKESIIGVEVFHRSAGYDPKADPIVRVEARRLRSKLEAYNESKPGDEIRIVLPRGGYVPVFQNSVPREPNRPKGGIWKSLAALSTAGSSPAARFWRGLLDGREPALLLIEPSVPATADLMNFVARLARRPEARRLGLEFRECGQWPGRSRIVIQERPPDGVARIQMRREAGCPVLWIAGIGEAAALLLDDARFNPWLRKAERGEFEMRVRCAEVIGFERR